MMCREEVQTAQDAAQDGEILGEVSESSLRDLINRMELVAYSLMRSGHSIAANSMFYAVSDMEKIKPKGLS